MIALPDPTPGKMPLRHVNGPPERVLHLFLGNVHNKQTSQVRALNVLGDSGYEQVPALAPNTEPLALEAAKRLKPSVIFIQIQQPKFNNAFINALRVASDNKSLVIINWSGDVGQHNAPSIKALQWAVEMGADLTLWSSWLHVEILRAAGATAGYLQIGYDTDYFYEAPEELPWLYDVAFLYNEHHRQLRRSLWDLDDCESRSKAGDALRDFFGDRATVGATQPTLQEAGDAYRQSKLAVSISASCFMARYTSDRLFRAMACTATMVKRFPGWRDFGLRDGENCIAFDSTKELISLAKDWSASCLQKQLRTIRQAGAKLVRENHTWDVRMQELRPLIAAVRSTRA